MHIITESLAYSYQHTPMTRVASPFFLLPPFECALSPVNISAPPSSGRSNVVTTSGWVTTRTNKRDGFCGCAGGEAGIAGTRTIASLFGAFQRRDNVWVGDYPYEQKGRFLRMRGRGGRGRSPPSSGRSNVVTTNQFWRYSYGRRCYQRNGRR
jgi:hypothetical protein